MCDRTAPGGGGGGDAGGGASVPGQCSGLPRVPSTRQVLIAALACSGYDTEELISG